MSLAACLKELRSERKWTQGDLCRAAGLERAYISRLESGKVKDLGLRNAMRIAKAFGVTVEQFVEKCYQARESEKASDIPHQEDAAEATSSPVVMKPTE